MAIDRLASASFRRCRLVAGIAIIVLLVFGSSRSFPLTLPDDEMLIESSPMVTSPSWDSLADAWHVQKGTLYIPLTVNFWTTLAAFGGVTGEGGTSQVHAGAFHLANLAVHLLNSILVYLLLRRIINVRWACAVGALVWSIHPLQSEPVAWASAMKDLLSGSFALASTLLYVSAMDVSVCNSPSRTWLKSGAAAALMLLAGFAKPGVAGIAIAAIAIGWLLQGRSLRSALLYATPMLAALIPAVLLARYTQDVSSADFVAPLWTRPLIAGHAIAIYLQHFLWPADLCLDYGLTPKRVLAGNAVYVAWLLPAAITVCVLAAYRSTKMLLGAWLVYLGGLLPVLGLVPFGYQFWSTVSDRYSYLALLGPSIAITWLLTRVSPRKAQVISAAIILLLAGRSIFQVQTWRGPQAMAEQILAVNERSSMAYNVLGATMMRDSGLRMIQSKQATGEQKQALRQEAMQINARAKELIQRAIEEQPRSIAALKNLATVCRRQGESDEALAALEQALDAMESMPSEFQPETRDRIKAAEVFAKRGNFPRAAHHLQRYLERHPNDGQAQRMLQQLEQRPATTQAAIG